MPLAARKGLDFELAAKGIAPSQDVEEEPTSYSVFDNQPTASPAPPSAPRRKGFSLFGNEDTQNGQDVEDETSPPKKKSLLSTVTSPLSTVLDVVTRPGAATAGAVGDALQGKNPLPRAWENLTGERKDSFSDVLEEQGMPEGKLRTLTGLAADIVVDPLNLVGVGEVKNAIKGAGALAKATKVGELATKGADALKATRYVQDAGKAFIPYHGLEKFTATLSPEELAAGKKPLTFKDEARLHASRRQSRFDSGAIDTSKVFDQPISKADAVSIANAIDKGTTLTNPRLEALKVHTKSLLDDQFNAEVAAGLMDPAKKIKNYITYLLKHSPDEGTSYRALSGKNKFSLTRETKSLEDAVAMGADGDVRSILAARLGGGRKALADNDFFLDAAKRFGRKGKNAPAGWRKVTLSGEAPLTAAVKGIHFPPEIAQHLEEMRKIPKEAGAWDEAFTATTALWKGYATRINPGFHLRNHVSNMANSWIGGMKVREMPQRYAEAIQWEKAPTAIGNHSPEAIAKALDEYGVRGSHYMAFDELQQVVNPLEKGSKFNPLNKHNAALEAGAALGNAVEGTARKALFFDQLHKGKSLEEAALHVRKYLFDYSELTDVEKKIRNYGVPFMTWMRKNIPLQIEAVLTQPHKIAAQGKVFNAVEHATAEDGIRVPMNERPDYMQEGGYVQLPTLTDTGAKVFANPSLPIQDLHRLDGKDLLASLNPIPRVAIELAMNKEAFTGRPIYSEATGTMGLKKANAVAEGVRQFSDKTGIPLADTLGIVSTARGTEMPAMTDYIMRQVPLTTTLGRTVTTTAGEKAGGINALGGLPSNVATLLGLSNATQTPAQRRELVKQKKREAAAARTAQRKEKTRLRKSEMSKLFAEWRQTR